MAIEQIAMTEAAPKDEGVRSAAPRLRWGRLPHEQNEARMQVRALAEANQRVDEFLGIAAHELRTPVTSSRLAVALAEQRLDTLLARLVAEDVEVSGQIAPIRDLLRQAEESLERVTRL